MNRRTRWTALGIAAALAALAFYPILAFEPPAPPSESAVEGFFFEPAQTSAQLIYAMAAVLFFGRRRWIASALRAGDPSGALPGVLFLGSSAALFVWSVYTETMDLRIVSLVLAMLGAALLLGGWRMLRSILRPTLFLLFAVPIPAFIVNQVVVSMQFGTAHLASALLSLLDFDVTQRADLIYARDHVFQVIESCSGLRFVVTLTMAAVAYTEIFNLHRWHAGLLIAASPILAFLLNGVRVLTIVLSVGTLPHAEDHTIQGLVMIVIGVLCLAPIDAALGRWLPERFRAKRREPKPGATAVPVASWRLATVIATLALLVVSTRAVAPWAEPVGIPPWGVPMPRSWGEYESTALTISPDFLGSLRFSKQVARAYEHGDERVEVFIGYDDLTNRSISPFSPRLPYPSSGWHVDSETTVDLDGFTVPVHSTLLGRDDDLALSYTWYEDARGPWVELARALIAVGRSSARSPVGITAVRLTTPVESKTGGLDAANQRLQRFASELRPKLIEATSRISSAVAQHKQDG